MEYTIVRSERKTVGWVVVDGVLEVRAPHNMRKSQIELLIASKDNIIQKKLAESLVRKEQRKNFVLHYDMEIPYRGRLYPIVARTGNRIGYEDSFFVPPGLDQVQIQDCCISIYRMLAKTYLSKRCGELAEAVGTSPSQVRISSARTNWGSCSAKGTISFTWKLIMADDDLIDYVIIQELVHLREYNHLEKFWKIVAQAVPDYQERRSRIRELEHVLAGQNWE